MFNFHSCEVVHESYVQESNISIDFEKYLNIKSLWPLYNYRKPNTILTFKGDLEG